MLNPIRSTARSQAIRASRPLIRSYATTAPDAGKPTTTTGAKVEEKVRDEEQATQPKKKKTMAEMDEELRAKLEARSGDGGASGLEYEGGKAVAMKRGVRDNMFRLI